MDEVLQPMTARQIAKLFGFKSSTTVKKWDCPCLERGSVGRGHKTLYDPIEVKRWLLAQWLPTVAAEEKADVLTRVATALYDVLKRDGLMGQTLLAERMAVMVYERCYRNINETPLQPQDLPEELKRVFSKTLDSVERRPFHGGDET